MPITAKSAKVIATLYNAYDQTIGTASSLYTNPIDIGTDQRANFEILISKTNSPIEPVSSYRLSVSADH